MPVSFSDVQLAFEFVSSGGMGENEAYLDRQSGKIYWHSEFGDNDEELPDDIDDEKYISIPDKRELDLGKPYFKDEKKADEVFCRLKERDDSFDRSLRLYAGAREQASAASGSNKKIYEDKAADHLRALTALVAGAHADRRRGRPPRPIQDVDGSCARETATECHCSGLRQHRRLGSIDGSFRR